MANLGRERELLLGDFQQRITGELAAMEGDENIICGQLRELDLDFRSGRFVALYGVVWRIEFMPSESKALQKAFGLRDVKLQGVLMPNTNDRVLRVTGVDMEGAT